MFPSKFDIHRCIRDCWCQHATTTLTETASTHGKQWKMLVLRESRPAVFVAAFVQASDEQHSKKNCHTVWRNKEPDFHAKSGEIRQKSNSLFSLFNQEKSGSYLFWFPLEIDQKLFPKLLDITWKIHIPDLPGLEIMGFSQWLFCVNLKNQDKMSWFL